MPSKARFILINAFFLVNAIFLVSGEKGYKIVLMEYSCKYSPKFASNISCVLNPPEPSISGNFSMQMIREVKYLRMDTLFYLERMKKYFLLYQALDIDACVDFRKNVSVNYVKLVREMIFQSGDVPACPIVSNYHFNLVNIKPNLDYLPQYLPEVTFKMNLHMKERKEIFLDLYAVGKIVHTNKVSRVKGRNPK